jgi:hypothetical protein
VGSRPQKRATISTVMSSAVGPRPPLVTIRSTPSFARNRSCAWMSRGTVTAGVMCARSTPSSISRSALQGRLRSSSPGEDLGSGHHDARLCTHTVSLAVVVGALGVVFGDIGTSPIYTVQTVFNPADPHPVPISTNVSGVVSLIFWSVMIIVTPTSAW